MNRTHHLLRLLALPFLFASLSAAAESLRVDVLVFLHPASNELPEQRKAGNPDDRHAIAMDDVQGLKQAGIQLLPENEFGLNAEWKALKARPGFEPLLKLAYQQENPPAGKSGPAIKLYQPVGDGSGLSGWLRLNTAKYGAVQMDVEYSLAAEGEGQPKIYRLSQKRQPATPAAIQYLDGGRLGVLLRLTRLGVPAATAAAATPTQSSAARR